MSAGRKHHADGNYLTDRQALRSVDVADANVDAVAEILDSRVGLDGTDGSRGHETTLALFILLDGPSGATIQVWGNGADEEESSSSSLPSGASEWCQYVEETLTKNTMLVYPQMPAGEYKIVVTSITGSGDVIVREAHSA